MTKWIARVLLAVFVITGAVICVSNFTVSELDAGQIWVYGTWDFDDETCTGVHRNCVDVYHVPDGPPSGGGQN